MRTKRRELTIFFQPSNSNFPKFFFFHHIPFLDSPFPLFLGSHHFFILLFFPRQFSCHGSSVCALYFFFSFFLFIVLSDICSLIFSNFVLCSSNHFNHHLHHHWALFYESFFGLAKNTLFFLWLQCCLHFIARGKKLQFNLHFSIL